jgi:hypothetical protein
MTRVRGLLRDAWTIARPCWWSEDRGAASRLLLVVAVLNLGIVSINVLLNQWNNTFRAAVDDDRVQRGPSKHVAQPSHPPVRGAARRQRTRLYRGSGRQATRRTPHPGLACSCGNVPAW